MKKILSIIISVILIISVLPVGAFTTSAATSGYYIYDVLYGEAIIFDCYTSISGDVTIPSKLGGYPVTGIGESAFEDCTNITSVTIPGSIREIESDAFYNCTSLASITIPDSVTSIGDKVFYNCESITTITVPDSVTVIGESVFSGCTNLKSITLPFIATYLNSTNCAYFGYVFGAFHYVNNKDYIPTSLSEVIITNEKTITNDAFRDCPSLKSITIGGSVTSIGDYAFSGCDNLTSITLPDSVRSIGDYAFEDCTSLKSITIPRSVTSIGEYAFSGCDNLTSITIPDSVTSIGESAFEHCRSLKSITIGGSVTSIGSDAFRDCTSLTNITVGSNNKSYLSVGGVLLNKDKTSIICYPAGKTATSYTIPDSVTNIGDTAFEYCRSLTSITIPDSVTIIGESAFEYCRSLTSITIPDSVTNIGDTAFEYCRSLTSITIPDNVTSIGDYAFRGCTSLTSITVGSKNNFYLSVGGVLFNKNKTVIICYPAGKTSTSYALPDGVTDVGDDAFSDCTSLKSIKISDSVTSIGYRAFMSCYSLTSITIPDSVKSIGVFAFYYCSSLKEVYYSGSAEDWENISIGNSNNCLTEAQIIYNYVCVHNYNDFGVCSKCNSYIESDHNYLNSFDRTWEITRKGAKSITVTFSSRTLLEEKYDFIYIYDKNGNEIGKYDGNKLASKSITVSGDTVKIRLSTDSSYNYYGFKITDIKVEYNGDLNGDNLLNAEDLVLIKNALLIEKSDTEFDINGNGYSDIRDIVSLKKIIAGIN